MRLALSLLLALAAQPALAATGEDAFNDSCGGCHTLDPPSYTAPALRGAVGRKIASLPDFQYSAALKAKSSGVWTEANLNSFLADPQSFASGTTMTASAKDPAVRQAIIDYLKTVK